MDRRLFLWGLSNGVTMLALAGAFWLGLGIGMVAKLVHWTVPAIGTLAQVGGAVWLVRRANRLRRRSGFQRSELRRFEGVARAQQRHIRRGMAWTTVGQTVAASVLVWICVRAQAEHLIWPSIGAVVSLHFAPLGRLFHVRPYYAVALAGSIVCALGFTIVGTPFGVAVLGLAMSAVMWLSAAYILRRADAIADQACAEPWAA